MKWLALLVLVAAIFVAAPAPAQDARAEAARLTAEAYARYHAAEAAGDGWAALYSEGASLAERAITLDPQSGDAHFVLFLNLGRQAERTSVSAQALIIDRLKELLDRALELDPHHAHAWEARGEMLVRLPWMLGGSEAKGEAALRRAAELAPQWAKPPLRLAQIHWQKGRAAEARADATRARDLARAAGDADYLAEAGDLLQKISAERR